MGQVVDDEIEQQRRAWKAQFTRDYERLTRNIGELESTPRMEWHAKAFFELRNHLQALDALNERVFTLLATLRLTQKRLAVAEAELAHLGQTRQIQSD